MQKLQEWGLHRDWWRNQRGELWVIVQAVLMIGFVLLPVVPVVEIPMPLRLLGTVILAAIALWLGVGGLFYLGDNLTPLPHPKDEGSLVTGGVYSWVRHPIYSSVIFLTLAVALWQMSLSHAIASGIFLVFFDRKSAQEEQWLAQKFPDYAEYKRSVKKLFPHIY